MKVNGENYRTIWLNADGWRVDIIDQTKFPHRFEIVTLGRVAEAAVAIKDMLVRGAPLIGATAAYGMALATREDPSDQHLGSSYELLHATRPTAINLKWALDEMKRVLRPLKPSHRKEAAYQRAAQICDEDVEINRAIGKAGLETIQALASHKKPGERVNVLTHCNAGWLATVDWGTATAPIYMAHDAGIPIHVWVDETRPRNQGASLTAWELGQHGVPFYVALPSPTIDFSVLDGVAEIPIEQRSSQEVTHMTGVTSDGRIETVSIVAPGSAVANYAFDVTPSRFVTGLITERGVIAAQQEAIAKAFPERLA